MQEVLNNVYTKIIAFTFTAILALTGFMYKEVKSEIDLLNNRVNTLYTDKVSREEFKEEMALIRLQNDTNKADILDRQNQMKEDIISRIDFVIRGLNNQNMNQSLNQSHPTYR